jgi:hypothetical protein
MSLPEWQQQFKAWYDARYAGKSQLAFENDSGVSRATWGRYLKDQPMHLDRLARDVKKRLYEATNLDCFRVDNVRYGRAEGGGKAPLEAWQVQVIEHVEKAYNGNFREFSARNNLNYNATRHLLEKVFPLDRLTKRTRDRLYKATGLDVLKCEERYVGVTWDGKKAPLNDWQVQLIRYFDEHQLTPKKVKERTGLSVGTLRGYTAKVIDLSSISYENRQKLYELTRFEIFRPNGQAKPEVKAPDFKPQKSQSSGDIGDLVDRLAELQLMVVERMPVPKQVEGDLVQQAAALFYALAQRLEGFKSSVDLRERLAKRLAKADVGRLTSLLHAMYKSKDDFDQWMLISGYAYGGDRQ